MIRTVGSILCFVLGVLAFTTCATETEYNDWRSGLSLHSPHIAGVCTQADRRNHIYRNNRGFAQKWEQCGRSSMGNRAQATQCLMNAYPTLSRPCASCFGDFVACSKSNCLWTCTFGSAQSCEDCANNNCRADLADCTGVPSSHLPSKY